MKSCDLDGGYDLPDVKKNELVRRHLAREGIVEFIHRSHAKGACSHIQWDSRRVKAKV